MKTILNQYPKILFRIIVMIALFGTATQLLLSDFFYRSIDFEYRNYDLGAMAQYGALIGSIAFIVAGAISDQIMDIKRGLMLACIAVFVGYAIQLLGFTSLDIVSGFLINGGNHLFFILLVLNIGVLFPVANDWKDNAFVLLFAGTLIVSFISALLIGLIINISFDIGSFNYSGIIAIIIIIGLAYWVNQSDDLGYHIESDRLTEEEIVDSSPDWLVLGGVTLLATLFTMSTSLTLSIGRNLNFSSVSYYFEFDSPWRQYTILGMSLAIPIILFVYLLKNTKFRSRQLDKILLTIILLVVIAIGVIISSYFMSLLMVSFLTGITSYLSLFLFQPAFLSILTHINIDKHAGLWLGIFFGVPQLLNALRQHLDE